MAIGLFTPSLSVLEPGYLAIQEPIKHPRVKLPVTYFANFSPYHDPDPISDFYDDSSQRITSIIATVIGVHLALFFMMSPRFVMPDLIEDTPEAISVELVELEEETPEPDPVLAKPVIKAPSVKPKPKPTPQPDLPLSLNLRLSP